MDVNANDVYRLNGPSVTLRFRQKNINPSRDATKPVQAAGRSALPTELQIRPLRRARFVSFDLVVVITLRIAPENGQHVSARSAHGRLAEPLPPTHQQFFVFDP